MNFRLHLFLFETAMFVVDTCSEICSFLILSFGEKGLDKLLECLPGCSSYDDIATELYVSLTRVAPRAQSLACDLPSTTCEL